MNCFLLARTGRGPCFGPGLSFRWARLCWIMRSSRFSRSCEREMNWGFRASRASWWGPREHVSFEEGHRRAHVRLIWSGS